MIVGFKQKYISDSINNKINLKKFKKCDVHSEDIYEQMLREEIDGNEEISVKHEKDSLKVEIISDSEDFNITFAGEQTLLWRYRFRQKK